MPRPLQVEETSGPRFDLALDQFEAGSSFVFLDCGLRVENGALQVLVPTQWEPHSITEARAHAELERAQRNIDELVSSSPRFSKIIGVIPRVFVLVYDYGMGGLWMCELRDGNLTWHEGYPRDAPTV